MSRGSQQLWLEVVTRIYAYPFSLSPHNASSRIYNCGALFDTNVHGPERWRLLSLSFTPRCCVDHSKLECGRMPNVMVALPNIGGALCKVWLTPTTTCRAVTLPRLGSR